VTSITLPLAMGLFFISGMAGLMYEVVWIRMLASAFGATVHSMAVVVAAFMAGAGFGRVGVRPMDGPGSQPVAGLRLAGSRDCPVGPPGPDGSENSRGHLCGRLRPLSGRPFIGRVEPVCSVIRIPAYSHHFNGGDPSGHQQTHGAPRRSDRLRRGIVVQH
jgi:hypothetical protein